MAQYLGFGNGSDGAVTLSGTATPIDSSCSGTSGATSLTATNVSFAANQFILIHQRRGTGVGQWEINQIASYVAGTITTRLPLSYTYTDSGASQAQVMVLPQYSSVVVSGTYSAKAWDENVGGILAFLCSGKVTVTGKIEAGDLGAGEGYSTNNQGYKGATTQGGQGEGNAGTRNSVNGAANGNGGGGGLGTQGAGAGGGNNSTGSNGAVGGGGTAGGTGGGTLGDSTLANLPFGGGGGRGGGTSGEGGFGGGAIIIYAREIDCSAGLIEAQGSDGQVGASPGAGGGGGAGGSIFIKAVTATIGTNKIIATGGTGGNGGGGGNGGNGSDGRIRIESCRLTGTSNPSASEQLGGHNYCTVKHGIL